MSPDTAALHQRKNDLKDIYSNQVNKANVGDDNKAIKSAAASKLLDSAIEKYK